MTLQLYNTLTKKKEKFTSLKNKEVKMYCCGPTVYNYAHIGNLRTFTFEDLLRRYLKHAGYHVKEAMNLTDVDDKTIKGSQKEKLSLKEFTEKYSEIFFQDLAKLHIETPEVICKATDHITEMVNLTQDLLDKGVAYKTHDGIYFSISKFKQYGRLSGINLEELKTGASKRVALDEYDKENPQDFALWKNYSSEDGDVYWETSIGKGRPGWHIECSAMAQKHLGDSFDIHCGGIDLVFPHHENEIAQTEASTGKQFVKYWLHAGHLMVDGKKMSKSLHNIYTLKDITQKQFTPLALRYFYISAHYRQSLNFTWEALENASNTQEKIQRFAQELTTAATSAKPQIPQFAREALQKFEEAMDDDLDTPNALAALHNMIRETNKTKLAANQVAGVLQTLKQIDSVLRIINWQQEKTNDKLAAKVELLLKARANARAEKNWTKADEIRDELNELNVIVEDTPNGVKWYVK